MEQAWTKPLIEDQAACDWLLSSSETVQQIAVNAISLDDIDKLATQYTEKSKDKLALALYFCIVDHCQLPVSESTRYAKMLVEIIQGIPESKRVDEDNSALVSCVCSSPRSMNF